MGEVYRAYDCRLDREVAVKILRDTVLFDEAVRRRFLKEALALAKLNHPNIQSVYEFDQQDGIDFLVTELIPGETLSEKLKGGPLTEMETARLGMQLAEGLESAHRQGVVHRDLKPSNLRMMPDRRLKILDFGLARLLRPSNELDLTASLDETRGVVGTLPYMSPEQLRGESCDRRTDIYAGGAVLYEMATGRRPFVEELQPRLTDAILHRLPISPRALNAKVTPELERIILKCLEKDSDDRYQSAEELKVDLRRLSTPRSTLVDPHGVSTVRSRTLVMRSCRLIAAIQLVYAVPFACNWFEGARMMAKAPASTRMAWTAMVITWVVSLGLVAAYLITGWAIARGEMRSLRSFVRWFPFQYFLDLVGIAALLGMAIKFGFLVAYLVLLPAVACLPFYQRHLAKKTLGQIQEG